MSQLSPQAMTRLLQRFRDELAPYVDVSLTLPLQDTLATRLIEAVQQFLPPITILANRPTDVQHVVLIEAPDEWLDLYVEPSAAEASPLPGGG